MGEFELEQFALVLEERILVFSLKQYTIQPCEENKGCLPCA